MDCSSERLSDLVTNEGIDFDADIAGPGVLAAFLATSLIALATLVAAFVKVSVPSRLLNTGDAVIVAILRRKHTKVLTSQSERTDAFMGFMSAISDQILVTQVAILIAAFIIHIEITIYSVNIVIALGCLASTVHLGSFPFYIDRLKNQGKAKLVRVIAMVAGSGMLVFMLVIQLSSTWDMETHVYFTCVMRDYRFGGDDILGFILQIFVPLTVLYGTYEVIQLLYRSQPSADETNDKRGEVTAVPLSRGQNSVDGGQEHAVDDGIPLQMLMLRRLEGQQPRQECNQGSNEIDRESLMISQILQWVRRDDTQSSTGTGDSYRQRRSELFKNNALPMSVKGVWHEISEDKRESLLNKWLKFKALTILTSEVKSKFKLHLQIILVAEAWAFHQCRGSFAWRILWLWSGNVYGIVTIFTSRAATTGMSGDPDKMGFGQVVPLALLALPVLAAMESHADYKEKLKPIDRIAVEHLTACSIPRSAPNEQQTISPEDTQNFHLVKEALKQRAQEMGYPYLYNWVTRDGFDGLRIGAGCHALFMLLLTTWLGVFMALGGINFYSGAMIVLLLFSIRRVVGLFDVVMDLRSCPSIIDHLGCSNKSPVGSRPVGDHAERVAVAQATGEAEQSTQQDGGAQSE